jgi:hypothetical protein
LTVSHLSLPGISPRWHVVPPVAVRARCLRPADRSW